MNKHRHFSKTAIAMLLIVLLAGMVTTVAYADRGPKPSAEITIRNAPEEYYIALLAYIGSHTEKKGSPLRMDGPVDYDSVNKFLDGFSYVIGESNHLYEWRSETGVKKGNGEAVVKFSYHAPSEFRVIIIEPDGTVHISDSLKRSAFHATCTYDFATGELTETTQIKEKTRIALREILLCILLTVVIELIVLKIMRFPFTRSNVLSVVVINVITNVLFTGWLQGSNPENFTNLFVQLEVIVFFAELLLYKWFLRDEKGHRYETKSMKYALFANLASAIATFIPL